MASFPKFSRDLIHAESLVVGKLLITCGTSSFSEPIADSVLFDVARAWRSGSGRGERVIKCVDEITTSSKVFVPSFTLLCGVHGEIRQLLMPGSVVVRNALSVRMSRCVLGLHQRRRRLNASALHHREPSE